MNNIPSEVIEDLLPLYRDDVLSGEVRELVKKRLEGSGELREKLDALESERIRETEHTDRMEKNFLAGIRRSRHYIIGIVIGALIPIGALLLFILYVLIMSRIA